MLRIPTASTCRTASAMAASSTARLLRRGDGARREPLASVEHGLRAQETADVVGSKRRVERAHVPDCR